MIEIKCYFNRFINVKYYKNYNPSFFQ